MSNDLENTKVVRCKDGTTKRIDKEQLQVSSFAPGGPSVMGHKDKINNFFEEHVEDKEK